MSLAPGTRLGAYEITAPLGAGGMGEVYRARDTKLHRDVAIKVLPDLFASDADRVARFSREAQTLAALNHPHIAQIYGVEESDHTRALVMEFVDGEVLAQRLARGPVPIDEALAIARQIADALEAAHDQGIIHRDLKPANVKLTAGGTVKVLDFGLAKAIDATGRVSDATADPANSPTLTSPAGTLHGMVLGTAAYMSPEQARGKPVDERADVWSFGCVLFEMLTGRRAFGGDEVTEIISSVLRDTPDLSLLPAAVPPHVRATLKSCLEKDARRRWHSMGDVQLLLDGQFDIGGGTGVTRRSASAARMRLMAAAILLATTTAAAVGALMFRRPAVVRPLTRLGLSLPGGATARDLTITPDGSKVVYVGDQGRRIYVRSLDALEPVEIANGAILAQLSISPNGRWVSFIDESTRLRKVPISGGPSSAVANLDGAARGVTWLTDDTLIVGTAARTGLLRVSASGAEPPTPITSLDDTGLDHVWPERLPGGKALLFGMEGATSGVDNRHVAALDMTSGRIKIVVRGGGRPRFVAGGFLAYGARGKTVAVPFRLDDLEVPEGATPLDLGFPSGPFAVSAEGTLVLGNGNAAGDDRLHTMVWVDRSGRETPIAAPARAYQYPQISPDGKRVAVSALREMADLWIWTQASATQTRLTLEPSTETAPLWTPDGKRLVFASNRADGVFNIWWQAADGTGSAERLSASPVAVFPSSVSPDGKQVVYWVTTPTGGRDLMMIALDGSRQVTALLQTPADELLGAISPDGRWLAYESNVSGQPNVYVRPFPRTDQGHWQVSMAGGRQPLWSRDGKELFFFSMDGEVMRMAVSAEAGRFTVGSPVRLFERRYSSDQAGLVARTYDVAPDGQRLLLLKSAAGADTPATAPEVIVVQNWDQELKRRMPVN